MKMRQRGLDPPEIATVIPETPTALFGIFARAGAPYDPVFARQHCMLQRARDDANVAKQLTGFGMTCSGLRKGAGKG